MIVVAVSSQVLVQDRFVPVIVHVDAILDGVIAHKVKVIAGVVDGFATLPEIPFAETTETDVTVPVQGV